MGFAKRKRPKYDPFIMLGKDMLQSDDWKKLSPAAKLLYIHIKAKHNGSNNGEICLHYSELKSVRGLASASTVSKAFKELAQKEWIKRTGYGGLYRIPNRYGMTGKHDHHISDPYMTEPGNYKKPPFSAVEKTWPAPKEMPSFREDPPPSSSKTIEVEATDSNLRS